MQRVKKAKPFVKKYKPVVAYLDALEEIVYTVQTCCEKIELSSEDYTFESLQDAVAHFGSRPQFDFKISGSKPSVQVSFSRMEASVYVFPDEKAAQLFHDLDVIVSAQQRTLGILYSNWMWLPVFFLLSIVSTIGGKFSSVGDLAYLGVMTAAFAWFVWISYVGLRRHSVLIFERRNQAKTFMDQNRNAIAMCVITSVLSGSIGYAFARLKDASCPPAISTEKAKE